MKCEECENNIPIEKPFFVEYYLICKEILERKNLLINKKIIKELEKLNGEKICTCQKSFNIKEECYKKISSINILKETFQDNNLIDVFFKDKKIHFIKNNLTKEEQFNFFKEEKKLWLLKDIENIIVSYEDFKLFIKEKMEKSFSEYLNLKNNLKNLVIFDMETVCQSKENFNQWDKKVIEIIENRKVKKLNTLLIFNNSNLSFDFSDFLTMFCDKELKEYYKNYLEKILSSINIKNKEYYIHTIENKELQKEKVIEKKQKKEKKESNEDIIKIEKDGKIGLV